MDDYRAQAGDAGEVVWTCDTDYLHFHSNRCEGLRQVRVVPARQLRGAVDRIEALERELGYAIDALEGSPPTGWNTDTARDTLQGGR